MTYLRELLVCPLQNNRTLLILRSGKQCSLLASLSGSLALIASSKPALEVFERSLNLPAKVLEPSAALLLGLETLLAEAQNLPGYHLGDPFRSRNAPK